jgi:protein-tyrosine kinase
MSRNFELLQRLGEEQEIFRPTPHAPAGAPPTQPSPTRPRETESTSAPVGNDPQINRLVQRLFFGQNEFSTVAAVSFCAVESSGAQSGVCARVAELMAQASSSVCAVDANLSNHTLDRYFGIENRLGIADALLSSDPIESFGQKLPSGLTVFPVGGSSSVAKAAALSGTMIARMSELRAQFDYVLIQAPCLESVPQASFIGGLSDGVVLIVEANSTRRDLASKLKIELQQANVTVLGAVLNNRTYPIPEKLYSKLF